MAFYANAPLPDTNARQATQTIRPSSTALLTIDSEDRYTDYVQSRIRPTSPYNFSITKSESLMPGFMTRLGISEVCFPWTIPNVNIKTNQILVNYQLVGQASVQEEISVPVGFYTPVSLASSLQSAIRSIITDLSQVTVQYGTELEPYFSYFSNAPGDVSGISFSPLPYNSADYPFSSQSKQLFDLLGMTTANSVIASSGTTTFTLCQAIRYIDIVCNQLTNSQAQKDQTSQTVARDMLCRLYLGDASFKGQSDVIDDAAFCPPGCSPFVIYRNFTVPKQIQWIPNQNIPGFLQFQVYDDAGDLLSNSVSQVGALGSLSQAQNTDWSMTLLVSEC
jgi:hypothetical protein